MGILFRGAPYMFRNALQTLSVLHDPKRPPASKAPKVRGETFTFFNDHQALWTLKQSPGSEAPPVSEAPSSELPYRFLTRAGPGGV